MKRFKYLLVVFAICGLFVFFSTAGIRAGECPPPDPDCIDHCKCECEKGQYNTLVDCRNASKEDKRDCVTLKNIFAECCFSNCLEDVCFVEDVPGESVVCEALERYAEMVCPPTLVP